MGKKGFVMVLLVALLAVGCQGTNAPASTVAAPVSIAQLVSVTGELVPATRVTLAPEVGGRVAEVLVEPGDEVVVGAPLVLLETGDLELALANAEAEVAAQEAALALLTAGATEATIGRADRDHAYEVTRAQIALETAQGRLAQAETRDVDQEVAAAEARAAQAQQLLAQARALDPAAAEAAAQVELERARIALNDARDEYNKALDRPWEPQSVRDNLADLVGQVELNYRAAQAGLDGAAAARRGSAAGIAALEAQLAEAEALLAQAEDAAAAQPLALDLLRADVRAAEEQLAYLQGWENPYRDPARGEEVTMAEARLEQARVAVAQIQLGLGRATVSAPFSGTVGAVHVRAGELVAAGQPVVVIGDLDTMRVETTDLDEIDVVRIGLDQKVDVTFDALPDRVFEGTVVRISPMATSGSGGVHYTVVVRLDEVDPALRWGMTAFVDIEAR